MKPGLSINTDAVILRLGLRVSDPKSMCFSWCSQLYEGIGSRRYISSAPHLTVVSLFGHDAFVRMLLDEGADINAQCGYHGNALQAASAGGHEQVVKMLLNNKAEVNAQGGHYSNALVAASARGHEQVVKILLNNKAEVNAEGGYYGNAL